MGNYSQLNVLSSGMSLFAWMAGLILCLIYQRLSVRLLIAAVGFGGQFLNLVIFNLRPEAATSDSWTTFYFFYSLCSILVVFGLGLAFADIQARLNRAHRRDHGDPYSERNAPDRGALPADEDLAPWRSNRENNRDIQL